MQILDGRESFYQWDINQKITGEFVVGDELHFWNWKRQTALVTIAYEHNGKVVADVPNILLQSSLDLVVFRYIIAEDSEYTTEEYRFKIKQRAKPGDYIYEETEVYNYVSVVNKALEEAKESGEFDGVSVTHSWDGTVLTITSASGTSSADLKGEKGEQGIQGLKGDTGEAGYTPIRGTDYWTEADKAEIKGYVDEAILGGAW